MGLDQYLYAKKYISVFDIEKNPKIIRMMNNIHRYLGIPKLSGKAMDILDTYPRVQSIEVLVAQWRKDYSVDGFFDEFIENKENGGIHFVPRSKLKELHDRAENVMVESENEWQQQEAERTVSMIDPLLTDKWNDYDFFYSSNW